MNCSDCNEEIEGTPVDFESKVLCQACAKDKRDELDEKLQDAELADEEDEDVG